MSIARYARLERRSTGIQQKIAQEEGVSAATVSKVMNERDSDVALDTRHRIRKAIARKFKMAYGECWPDGL